MSIIISILVNAAAVFVVGYILPGIQIENFFTAVVIAIVLGVFNTFIKPFLIILTLPATILTLGLFIFVINALLVLLASAIIPGFLVDGFIWALVFSFALSVVNSFLQTLNPVK